jgi:hypothetical protein
MTFITSINIQDNHISEWYDLVLRDYFPNEKIINIRKNFLWNDVEVLSMINNGKLIKNDFWMN